METRDIVCYLPIEIKSRELDAKIYLALRLIEKGFSVVIGRKSGVNYNIFLNKKPFVYFDKGISLSNWNFYSAIRASRGQLVEIDEEGAVGPNLNGLIVSHNNPCSELFSLIFTWGKFQKKLIEDNCIKLKKSVLKPTGHPSFDLLHKDLIHYYSKLVKSKKRIEPGYILINTNFPTCNGNISFEESKKLNENAKGLYTKEMKNFSDKLYKFQETNLLEFLKMIKNLSKSFPEKNIVVRPHPFERMEPYEQNLKYLKNVFVIKEGSAREFIVGAEAVIHYDCTTGIEAYIAGKKVISYCPFYDENFAAKIAMNISVKIVNSEDLIKYIKSNYKDENNDSVYIKAEKLNDLSNFMANVSTNATDQIISNIEAICDNFENLKFNPLKRLYYLQKIKINNLISRIKGKLKYASINTQSIENNQKTKFPYLEAKEILERLEIWYEHFSIDEKYEINKLEGDTYFIKKSKKN